MTATNFNTENRTYRQLLGNGITYRIPRFQRDYSWTETEWEDLWIDIVNTFSDDGESAHYMGYLVLQTSDNRVFEVIDGQQRLTTLSVMVLAAMRLLKKLGKKEADSSHQQRLDQLRATYIGYLDPVTLTSRNKLSLNRNNDGYYQDYLVPLADTLPQRGFPSSTHSMRKGFEWFEDQLRRRIQQEPDSGMALARFVETMSDKLFFTVITVADELNAYKVFETLNARGVRLSSADLLKNYLFSVLARSNESPHEMDQLERRWELMVNRLDSESLPDFLRMHWNSRHTTLVRQAELFKTIRQNIQTREAVFELLRLMDEDVDTYLALTRPESSQWYPAWVQSTQELKMFSVRQPYPMLMAAHRCLPGNDFETLLRATVVISFRYNVISTQLPGEQERVYHTATKHLLASASVYTVLDSLHSIYPTDKVFVESFAEKSIKTTQSRNAKVVRYILSKLEKQGGGPEVEPYSSAYTIEHVLPQAPGNGWESFTDSEIETFTHRLGNMVLLEASKNKDIGNQSYPEKRKVLVQSSLLLTRQLAEENDDWTPEQLTGRQRQLAKMATAVWRISQLSS